MTQILLYHLSDLHIGSHHLGTTSNIHSGRDGHHFQTARELQDSLMDPAFSRRDFDVTKEDRLALMVGGDLTRIGADYDFHLAWGFLRSTIKWTRNQTGASDGLGLNWPEPVYAVPGNHDHWQGFRPTVAQFQWTRLSSLRRLAMPQGFLPLSPPPAFNPALSPGFLEPTPWHHSVASNDSRFSVELFGIDSNSGLRGTNLPAAGEIADEQLYGKFDSAGLLIKDGLEQLLSAAHRVVKVPSAAAILCHHAFTKNAGLLEARPLSKASRGKLLALARKYHVRAVLTGHMHTFLESKLTDSLPHVWELRCGTTLQLNAPNQEFYPGYYVHQFELDPGGRTGWNSLSWKAWQYRSANGRSFVRNAGGLPID